MWTLHILILGRGSLWGLPQSKDMKLARLTGEFTLLIGVNMRANGCLSVCISPVTDWRPQSDDFAATFRITNVVLTKKQV